MESRQLLNLVEFKFLRNSYPLIENLPCYFSQGTHVPQIGDWVGIFKVGWKNLNEYKVRKQISVESIESIKRGQVDYSHVVFEHMHLPKDLEGFHQFVYVAKGDVVRGVSRPFEFEVESKLMKEELKEIKREMWNNIEEREMWGKLVDQEREQREREREIFEQREQREKREQREQRELRELRERERELREMDLKGLRFEINNNKVMETMETELLKGLSHGRTMEKLHEDSIVNKLLQRYLSNIRSKKDEELTKKFEELFVENIKHTSTLKSKIEEVSELKKECDDLKRINSELLLKITTGERRVEQLERDLESLEREREIVRRQMEERESSPCGKMYLDKVAGDLDETKSILKEENERLREELRRLTVLYQTESENFLTLKNKWMKIDEALLNKRLGEKINSEIEKSTLLEVRGLKKMIDELKCENEALKTRIRYENELRKPINQELTVQFPITSKTTIIKEKSSTHVPKVNSQPEYLSLIETRPIGQESYPISVSTSIPEISSKTSVTVSGKLAGTINEQTLRGCLNKVKVEGLVEDQLRSTRPTTIAEQLRHDLEKLNAKLVDIKEAKELNLLNESNGWIDLGKEVKVPMWVLSSQTSTEEPTMQKMQRIQKQIVKHYEEQTKQQLKEQLSTCSGQKSINSICPVCGIAVSKELNQTEFELHVNSHFTD